MASTNITTISSNFQHFQYNRSIKQISLSRCCCFNPRIKFRYKQKNIMNQRVVSYVRKPITALASGMEASISGTDDNFIALKDAKFNVESRDDYKIQLRVDVTGIETQKVFNKVLTDLARQAPPIPGFRKEKGGKTTKVPREFLLQILGEERVIKFVIQEIVTSTVADYAKKENLNVKDNKVSTSQTTEELKISFSPGKEFGFNAVLELEESEKELEESEKELEESEN